MISIVDNRKRCYKCGTTLNLHQHHIFYGKNRKKSDKDGCWVWLCGKHHNLSNQGVHFDKQFDKELKEVCEGFWLKYYNKSIDDFIERYGRNYL